MAAGTARDTGRLFAVHAVMALVPVVLLGTVLGASYRGESNRRGLAQGRSEAALVAETAVEPLLSGHLLHDGLRADERAGLTRLVRAVNKDSILRLRIRDLQGYVVFSDDGSGFSAKADDEAVEAGEGKVVSGLRRLNRDVNDHGPLGTDAVEVYTQLDAGPARRPVGVLEVYLPYARIRTSVNAGLHHLYLTLALGLAALYVVLFLIAASVSKGLRRHARLNAFLAEHDTLTELPNRTLFHQRAQAAVTAAERAGHRCAIAIIDLDRFKEVNDTLGHHNGDALIIELAGRLNAASRAGDTVARLGGDEFGIVLANVEDAESTLVELRTLIGNELEISGLPLSIEASVGYVV
ncbi:MAG: hypothetical protein QOI55_2698, partial [Actinomycetota bacterium]|nr:hypothetical protein [Actinomycetota bacterium]